LELLHNPGKRIKSLKREDASLLLVDVQERLLPLVERSEELLSSLKKLLRAMTVLKIPVFVTEQYPSRLGTTMPALKQILSQSQVYYSKTTFSCGADVHIREVLERQASTQWIVVGIETHVCVLQTVRDLLNSQKEVVVLNDAVSSRSIFDYSTAIAEMRDMGARISSIETILFELLGDSKVPEFKEISELIKSFS
jgi:nicotinamidase-related amidase